MTSRPEARERRNNQEQEMPPRFCTPSIRPVYKKCPLVPTGERRNAATPLSMDDERERKKRKRRKKEPNALNNMVKGGRRRGKGVPVITCTEFRSQRVAVDESLAGVAAAFADGGI